LCQKKKISSREKEIIFLVIKGISNKEIEDKLFISPHTVKNHIYNIFQKLNISSRGQLTELFKNIYFSDNDNED
ncbi:MAG: helix-turn-helix transcriptional regulator, partial [Candidatus Aminicenantes bacterium]|nr:helix-turn-helix transcriptional regulator [Candidatus Aminicenantes bacterium]